MNELDEFKKVLDDDETIVKSYKPNKTRFIWLNILVTLFPSLLVAGFFVIFAIVASIGNGEEDSFFNIISIILFAVASFIVLMASVGTALIHYVRYGKTCYVVTNKRLVIKSGFIGVDFSSLDLNMVQLVDVKVGFYDKFIKPNTGTIIIGSSSTPIVNQPRNRSYGETASFSFSNVDNPYDVAKEIKSYIASIKK